MDKDAAREAIADYEAMEALFGSNFGSRLLEKLDELDKNAVDKAMRGPTPESNSVYLESRGKVLAVKQIRDFFHDVDTEHQEANAILNSQVAVSEPADTSSSGVESTNDEAAASPETE